MPSTSIPQPIQPLDVLVIGGGAAGLYAALSLPKELRIGLVTKDTLSRSASDWAQGGVAAALAPTDSPRLHAQDTLRAGAGLCDPAAVQFLVEQAPEQVERLLSMGVAFDRHGDRLAVTLEAAHSQPRVLHAADTTGRALVTTLTQQVLQRPYIQVFSQALVLSLWLHPQTQACQGAVLIHQGQIQWVAAAAVVLATGGGGQVFAHTTNPPLSTGDGVAMAWRAGAVLRDLEFVQFHPTALTVPAAPRFLISEAVRGEGAHLIDHRGRRFVFDYHPAGELAPRDIVSRAVYSHLAQNPEADHVWLDLRPIPPEQLQRRFPKIIQVCRRWGVDVFQEPIPVAPAAHYWMGGVATDLESKTSISGLYAIGEVANTGVHGANRLASNSLLECLVFGAQLAELSPAALNQAPPQWSDSAASPEALAAALVDWPQQWAKIEHIRQSLPELVWQSAGICRQQDSLDKAIAQITGWRRTFAQLPWSRFCRSLQSGASGLVLPPPLDSQIRGWVETENLLDVAHLILKSAAFRTESRGGHYRRDYPGPDPKWQVHTLVQGDRWYTSTPVNPDE